MGSFIIAVFAFGVGLVAVFGMFEDEQTHFSDFGNAFKTLFWIIFDPGEQKTVQFLIRLTRAGLARCGDAQRWQSLESDGLQRGNSTG